MIAMYAAYVVLGIVARRIVPVQQVLLTDLRAKVARFLSIITLKLSKMRTAVPLLLH